MVTYKHNQPHYEFHFSDLSDDAVNVLSFEGREEISGLYEYKIELVSKDPELDSAKILNKSATFFLNRGDEDPIRIHGIVSDFEQFGRTPDYVFYRVILVPQIWRLGLVFQNEVYQDMNIQTLTETLLKNIGLSGQDYKFDFKESYPEKEYVVQYRETSLNFLNRRLEHFGIYYYFDHSGDRDVVVFTDSNSLLKDLPLESPIGYNINKDPFTEKETVHEVNCREKVATGTVQLKDYNYMFPEKQLMAQSQLDNAQPGFYYDFGDNFENENEAGSLAKVRNQELLLQKKIFYGKSDCRYFAAGYKFTMEKHYRQDWNSEYIITKVVHRGNQHSLFGMLPGIKRTAPTYENSFTAIPSDIEYRPARRTPIPKISGIMSAKLESGSGDEYAFIDDNSRYRFKALFDISDKTNGEASLPIRLLQSYSGSDYGIHFPNHKNTELIWACVDGNVDRPVGIGTAPNPSQASPVAAKNKTHNLIRTAAGNEILLDDKSNECQIAFKTSDAHKILMDDKDDKIEVTSKDKHKILMDDKNQNITVNSKDGHTILLDDKNTRMVITSKKGHFILIDDGGEKIQVSDESKKNNLIIDIKNNKLVIESKDGSIDLLAKNEIKLKTKKIILDSEVETNCKTKDFVLKASKDITVKASSKITQEAQSDLKLKGMNLEAKADMNAKVEAGMNLDLKGNMAAKLQGGISADVQGGAKTSVKGAVVMIN